MGPLVGGEVVCHQCGGQGGGLTEAESHAFAGDGVDGAGGVADKGDVAGGDSAKLADEGDGPSSGTAAAGVDQAAMQGREVAEGLGLAGEFFLGDKGDADLDGGVGGDVGLAEVAPVDLDKFSPRGDGVVLT